MDAFDTLQTLSFRGLQLPFTSFDVGFSQDSANKKFTFKDEQLIQRLGRTNETFRYEIPFYNGLKPFGNLFKDSFSDFYDACLSREPAQLIDPLRGSVRAVVATLQVHGDPSVSRSGCTVSVEFVKSPESLEADETPAPDIARTTQEANDAFQGLDGIPASPEFTQPLVNPLSLGTGVLQQVSLQRDKINASIERETARVDRLTLAVEDSTDPEKYDAKEKLLDYKKSLLELNTAVVQGGRNIQVALIRAPITIISLAKDLSLSTEEFLELNQELGTSVVLYPGTPYYYPQDQNA